MGEAKRRKNLGLAPREKKTYSAKEKVGLVNKILAKYPYFPYILGISVLLVLIIDLVNYYK